MIKNIIFDMDGVLIDSERAIQTACKMMFGELGVQTDFADFTEFVGMGENRFIGGVAAKYGMDFELSMKDRVYEIYGEIAGKYIKTYSGIRELVLALKERGYTLAIASSADDFKVAVNLRHIGLARDDFDAVVTGSEVEKKKPDPAIFIEAARRISALPSQSLVIEDALSGCIAARSAGMRCIGVSTSFTAEKLLEAGAENVIAETKELLDILHGFEREN